LLRALGTKNDARYNLKIVDNDMPEGDRPTPAATSVKDEDDEETEENSGKVVDTSTDKPVEERESVASRTRKELAELDDLDI
jgi:hypothetical protein